MAVRQTLAGISGTLAAPTRQIDDPWHGVDAG